MDVSGLDRAPQRRSGTEQALLADDFVERARSHALGERFEAFGLGEQLRRRSERLTAWHARMIRDAFRGGAARSAAGYRLQSRLMSSTPTVATLWQLYEPKLWTVLRRGYRLEDLRHDAIAGLTVAIVALPLAMALAIASGTTPEKGLHTAIIAGFLISFLGGSRVQIGGPTAAFIPVVFNVIDKFGYGGLILCTLLAGFMLIGAGVLRVGTLLKYIPKPVVTGFTSGIAVSIFASQVKDLLGLRMGTVPAEFFARWTAYFEHLPDFTPAALAITLGCVAIIALHTPLATRCGRVS